MKNPVKKHRGKFNRPSVHEGKRRDAEWASEYNEWLDELDDASDYEDYDEWLDALEGSEQ